MIFGPKRERYTSSSDDHMSLYRQQQCLSRHGISIADSTGRLGAKEEIICRCYMIILSPISKLRGIYQVDETPIQVQDPGKKGKTHREFYWDYYSPLSRSVLFDYQPMRSCDGLSKILNGLTGTWPTHEVKLVSGLLKN